MSVYDVIGPIHKIHSETAVKSLNRRRDCENKGGIRRPTESRKRGIEDVITIMKI